jgi:hypothetical protein
VVSGYAVLVIGAGLDAVASGYDFPEPASLMILRISTTISFAVVGWAWWLHLDDAGTGPPGDPRGRSFWLFALAAVVLAIGQISLFWYYVFPPAGALRIFSPLSVVTLATGLTVVGYVLVAAGFWLATRRTRQSVEVTSSDDR